MLVIWLLTIINNIFFTMVLYGAKRNNVNGPVNGIHTIFILLYRPITNYKQ